MIATFFKRNKKYPLAKSIFAKYLSYGFSVQHNVKPYMENSVLRINNNYATVKT